MLIAIIIFLLWGFLIAMLFISQRVLLHNTWSEPYIYESAVLIESDDWGPGDKLHATRLNGLSEMLSSHTDSSGRPAVLTADMILAVPDVPAINAAGKNTYIRRFLDNGFRDILDALNKSIEKGTLVPQLHGMEHYHGKGLLRLYQSGDPRVRDLFSSQDWNDWESLDSPLQGHYVDGTKLPTLALSKPEREELIGEACKSFVRLFNIPSKTTVAPCYLWDDEVERIWASHGIRYIQTAGYRCPGRDAAGNYIQDLPLIRTGQQNAHGQYYLVRNAMYEPADARSEVTCVKEAHKAIRQGLPVAISTHRYNYTRTDEEYRRSVHGLDKLLTNLETHSRVIRYLSSPELGAWIAGEPNPLTDPTSGKVWPGLTKQVGLKKMRNFLYRLWYRHTKLRILATVSGLVIPFFLFTLLAGPRFRRTG